VYTLSLVVFFSYLLVFRVMIVDQKIGKDVFLRQRYSYRTQTKHILQMYSITHSPLLFSRVIIAIKLAMQMQDELERLVRQMGVAN